MAKKRKPKTQEEILMQERERELSHLAFQLPFIPEPTVTFEVGEEVSYGALKSSVIKEILFDGKAYGMECIRNNRDSGKEELHYLVAPWISIYRKGVKNSSDLSRNQEVTLYFSNSTIESLLHRCYFFGVDFNPDYQRDYVWEQSDREKLIGSVFENVDIGKFVFATNIEKAQNGDPMYEIVDGKQRLNALMHYYENRFPYKGYYYRDLSGKDKGVFLRHNIVYADITHCDRKEILNIFLMLNTTGRQMSEEHLEKVRQML